MATSNRRSKLQGVIPNESYCLIALHVEDHIMSCYDPSWPAVTRRTVYVMSLKANITLGLVQSRTDSLTLKFRIFSRRKSKFTCHLLSNQSVPLVISCLFTTSLSSHQSSRIVCIYEVLIKLAGNAERKKLPINQLVSRLNCSQIDASSR